MRSPLLLVLVSYLLLLAFPAKAEIPQMISYQGKVTDSGGATVPDGSYDMVFWIYDQQTGGSALWNSGTLSVDVTGGVFSALLGEGTPISLNFDDDYWLEVAIESDIQSPRQPLGSVGYAYMASGLVPGTVVEGDVSSSVLEVTNTRTGSGYGVRGNSDGSSGRGVYGRANSTTGTTYGVYGHANSTSGRGVYGAANAATGITYGVYGSSSSSDTEAAGVYGVGDNRGVYGKATDTTGTAYGGYFESASLNGIGVQGYASSAEGPNYGVYGATSSPTGYGGGFWGDVIVIGSINKSACSFLIDHPLDPENRLLRHNCMESPEHLVVYRGKVQLDADGEADVEMPEYFKALAKEDGASIHLTPIGTSPFMVSGQWNSDFGSFKIYGDPAREVFWEVLAERDDPGIRRLARPVEEYKGPDNKYCDKGDLLDPIAYGYPESMGRDYERMEKARRRTVNEKAMLEGHE